MINYTIDSNLYPCTWGTFSTICYIIHNLPLGSQALIRDVAEVYQTIPITYNQWPGLVVKLQDNNSFMINTCNNFGLSSAGGIYGELGDATMDIFQARGISPLSKWVDDHIFFCIHCEYLPLYNAKQEKWCENVGENGGQAQSGSQYWYQGLTIYQQSLMKMPLIQFWTILIIPFVLPLTQPLHIVTLTLRLYQKYLAFLGKDQKPSPLVIQYPIFNWNLLARTVSVMTNKKEKYKSAIKEWLSKLTHSLEEVQKLYRKLLHISLIIPVR